MSAAPAKDAAEDAPASRFPVAEFRRGMEAHDPDAVLEHWTEDCVLRPLGTDGVSFVGKDEVRACLKAVLSVGQFRYGEELRTHDTVAVFFHASFSGLEFEAIDILRIDENGKCREMFVMGRPYMPISVFTGRVAIAFARQGGGVPRRLLISLLVAPLELTQRATEPVRARLVAGAMRRQLKRAARSR
jgi:hypothetical protein